MVAESASLTKCPLSRTASLAGTGRSGRMTLTTGGERRPRWSDEDRARILAEVTRREEFCTSLVYQGRRQARAAANTAGFAEVVDEPVPDQRRRRGKA
jgi:transposase-like protein